LISISDGAGRRLFLETNEARCRSSFLRLRTQQDRTAESSEVCAGSSKRCAVVQLRVDCANPLTNAALPTHAHSTSRPFPIRLRRLLHRVPAVPLRLLRSALQEEGEEMTRPREVRTAIRLRHLDPLRRCGHITRRVESRSRIDRSRSRDRTGVSGGGAGGGRRARSDYPSSEPSSSLYRF
jgi:hypothetical protein